MGNMTKDFELHTAGDTTVGRSSMALDAGQDKPADFVNVVAFGKQAETLEKWAKKGKRMLFETHVKTGSYEKDGKKVYTTDFIIDRFEFASNANESNKPAEDSQGFMNIPDGIDAELPFH